MKKKFIPLYCLIAAFSGLFLFSAWKYSRVRAEYKKSGDAYAELLQEVVSTAAPAEKQESTGDGEWETILWPSVDFARLAEINPDVVAWLKIDNTPVDYPVVQGEDNWYWLEHLFDGEESFAGSLMLDCGNAVDFSDPNSVIYGHHLKDGTMFAQLESYREEGFYEKHPTAVLITPEKNYLVRFFAGVLTPLDTQAWNLEYAGKERAEWLREAIENSTFRSDIVPGEDDRILTLSTCSDDGESYRYILLGVLESEKQ